MEAESGHTRHSVNETQGEEIQAGELCVGCVCVGACGVCGCVCVCVFVLGGYPSVDRLKGKPQGKPRSFFVFFWGGLCSFLEGTLLQSG